MGVEIELRSQQRKKYIDLPVYVPFESIAKRRFLCFSLKQLSVEADRICSGREFQYFTHEYVILFLSDEQFGFGRLKRSGLRIFLENISETGDLM